MAQKPWTRRTDEQWAQVKKDVETLVQEGQTKEKALERVGVSSSQYSTHIRRLFGENASKIIHRSPSIESTKSGAFKKFVPEGSCNGGITITIGGAVITVTDKASLETVLSVIKQ